MPAVFFDEVIRDYRLLLGRHSNFVVTQVFRDASGCSIFAAAANPSPCVSGERGWGEGRVFALFSAVRETLASRSTAFRLLRSRARDLCWHKGLLHL